MSAQRRVMPSRRIAPPLLTSLCFALSLACSSGGGGNDGLDPGLGDAPPGDGSVGAGETDPGFDVGGTCAPGAPCGTSGVCNTANLCCEPAGSVCGAKCCGSGQLCYAGSCVTPGKICRSVEDCADGETCDPSLGGDVDAGVAPGCGDAGSSSAGGRCVPRPPVCPPGVDPSGGTCVAACEYHPPLGKFDTVTEWSWPTGAVVAPTYNQVMASAVVGPLTDDNCDSKFDEKDIPAIVFNTYAGAAYGSDGILRAVTGKGATLWNATDAAARTVPGASIALGEIDPTSPGPEIATCQSASGNLLVFSAKGKVLWTSADPAIKCVYGGPQLGDVNGDGTPELLVRYTVVDAKTHKSIFAGRASAYSYPTADYSAFSDVDGDGDLDIVGGNVVYANDGTGKFSVLWDGTTFSPPITDGYIAIADLDLAADGHPEIAIVSSLEQSMHTIRVVDALTGKTKWGPVDTNMKGEAETGGGPPTIADFDGDGKPEIAMAGGYTYNVFDGATGKVKWSNATTDHSSRVTGSSVFDFDGDGKAEVVYADERNLHVYDGKSGTELLTLCNPSGTLWEYPLVADVDGDDQAEIVLVANDMWWGCGAGLEKGTGPTGLRVIGSKGGNWVRTRRIWNEHTYHVTNINDDATIPKKEAVNWKTKGLNDFRQNVQPKGLFDAPNAILELDGTCSSPATIRGRVRNIGQATLPAGVVVGFYSGDPKGTKTKIGTGTTTKSILPGGFDVVEIKWDAPGDYRTGALSVFGVVDDGSPVHAWHECKTDDDTSAPFKAKCTL
jgi:hypothetical protein